MTTFKAGTVSWFGLDNASGSVVNLQPYMDKATVPQSQDTLNVSVFGTAEKAFIVGLSNGDTIPIGGPYDVGVHTHLTGIIAAQKGGTVSHSWVYGPGGSVAAQAKVNGECIVANYNLDTSVAGRVEWSATLQVTGAVTNGTF